MGQLRSAWQQQKTTLSQAHASAPFLKEDFGPKLDEFEGALSKFEKARETKQRSDPSLQPLRATLKTTTTRVTQTAVTYEKELRYMGDHARDAQQKKALLGAAGFLMHLLNNEVKRATSYQ